MATDKKQLYQLMSLRKKKLQNWAGLGKIPHHYKRLSVSSEDAVRLALLGLTEVETAFNDELFFTQSLIAGAMLSGEFDRFIMCTSSQYGKSWLLARTNILLAYEKQHDIFIAGGRKNTTEIIMRHILNALPQACPEIQNALLETQSQLERLAKSLSKTRISFHDGGSIEGISLGDAFKDKAGNNAIGRGGDYVIDEAALVSADTLAEVGRVDFSKLDGEKCMLTMISNPHNPGEFWDELTQEEVPPRTFILWADALTAVEEERFTEDAVINGDFANNKSTLRRYLLCELDVNGESMFDTPKVYTEHIDNVMYRFLGVDAAYKGKDDLCISLISVTEDGKVHAEEIEVLDKSNWIDGVTNHEIIDEIARISRAAQCSLVCVDQGWGVWLIQGLEDKRVPVKGIGFQWKPTREREQAKEYAATNAYNMRAEMHLDLQNIIERGIFDIHVDAYEKIKDTLPFVLCDRASNGRIKVRPKVDIKQSIGKSPDELDSLLLAVHAMIVFFGENLDFVA